jgi:hypothetical protein
LPDPIEGLQLQARVKYHILTEKAYQKLKDQYGLQGEHPYNFTIYERTVSLAGPLSAEMITLGRARSAHEGTSCTKKG